MRKKLASKGGFTFSELLVALAIVALIGAAVAAGIPAAMRVYDSVTGKAEALSLTSSLESVISDELRFASDAKPDGSFTSQLYGVNTQITSSNGRVWIKSYPLLGEKSYSSNLNAEVAVTYQDALFQVEITILRNDEILHERSYTIHCANT